MDENVNDKVVDSVAENEEPTKEKQMGMLGRYVGTVYYSGDELSFALNLDVPDDRFQDKVIDESKSIINVFSRDQLFGKLADYPTQADKLYLPNNTCVISCQLKLVDAASYTDINDSVIDKLVDRLLQVDDNPCAFCARQEKCSAESDAAAERCEEWKEPDTSTCSEEIRKYYFEQAKND